MQLPSAASHQKLEALRQKILDQDLDALVISKNDAHRLEYGETRDNGIFYLSGFDGSAGLAAVTVVSKMRPERITAAAVFTDGRYTLQVKDQVDQAIFETKDLSMESVVDWLSKNLDQQSRVGFASEKFSIQEIDRYKSMLAEKGLELVALDHDPTLVIWGDRPDRQSFAIEEHPLEYAGLEVEAKIEALRAFMAKKDASLCVLNALESVAWLFNLRAKDRRCMPAPDAFAVIAKLGKAHLFIDHDKLSDDLKAKLSPQVTFHDYEDYFQSLATVSQDHTVLLDPSQNSMRDYLCVREQAKKVIFAPDPTVLPRARKNAVEIKGAVKAHEIDAIAVIKTLAWLDRNFQARPKSAQKITELDVVEYLYKSRSEAKNYFGPSFDAISGSGPNGAIVHYRASQASNRTLKSGDIFLLDSGGQYPEGTTDITRTIYLGSEPNPKLKCQYTLVLKGHLALSSCQFPQGTTGSMLDPIARQFLWSKGLDYAHGTGHGVGSFLGVHEGPQRISAIHNTIALEPGMILSNEPGYYETGSHGIRIENLIYVKEKRQNNTVSFLGFETLTLVPYDRRLIDVSLLSDTEIDQINRYHVRVFETLKGELHGDYQGWLEEACREIDLDNVKKHSTRA